MRQLFAVDLARINSLVITADLTHQPRERYLVAHQALTELALLALRVRAGRRSLPPASAQSTPTGGPQVWRQVATAAPELVEWVGWLTAIQPRRDAAARGDLTIAEREADDLVAEAEQFAAAVASLSVQRPTSIRSGSSARSGGAS